MTKNQEEAFDLVGDVGFFPELTVLERALFNECQLTAGDRWSARILRKVLGTPLVRDLSAKDPDLVRKAFLIAARDEETTSPRRLLWLDKCPHWDRARTELAAQARKRDNDAGEAGKPAPSMLHDANCSCGGSGWINVAPRVGAEETIARCRGQVTLAQAS